MDLNSIIQSENAGSIQLVVTAKDLKDLLDGAIAWGMKTIKERDEPTFYTIEELCEVLHVSEPTLLSYRKKSLVPEPMVMDRRALFDKAEVREYFNRNKRKFRNYKEVQL